MARRCFFLRRYGTITPVMSEGTRLDHITRDRREKLAELRATGHTPFPAATNRTGTIAHAREQLGRMFTIAGRIRAIREHGKSVFFDISDETGMMQAYCKADVLGDQFAQLKLIDPGDCVAASGEVGETKSGEPTVFVQSYRVLAKAVRPLPRSWQELENVEERFRRRYLDLLSNAEVLTRFRQRSAIIHAIRSYYVELGFLEVDTPILQPIPGGASARPFTTQYHAYDTEVYLRVAPELYLKRLLVGGFERVFEFARCFRNEGADQTHNPEFTQIEIYAAYWDYEDMMASLETLIRRIVHEVFGTDRLTLNGHDIDFSLPFTRQTFLEVSGGGRDDASFKAGVRRIIQPTFVTNHPAELIPLAKRRADDPTSVESFQLVIAGIELAKGYSELNDHEEQRERFLEQEQERSEGNEEAQRIDTDFIEALEYGMPPAAGLGIGIDRLVTVLTGAASLREAMLFPYMKPRHGDNDEVNHA